ncbi:unnamed protein product, partial [Brassica napus]
KAGENIIQLCRKRWCLLLKQGRWFCDRSLVPQIVFF